nr:triphosphoribosyl-dephospho-CoA synthase [Candidatus Sigynarchaeota archaeon]
MAEPRIVIGTPADVGRCCALASLLEVSASPKPGNVHRFSRPEDHKKSYEQFLSAIAAMTPHYASSAETAYHLARSKQDIKTAMHLGNIIEATCESMMAAQTGGNLLLGHVLLLIPLAASIGTLLAGTERSIGALKSVVGEVVRSGNTDDVISLYKGIKICNPGGLGTVEKFDVNSPGFVAELRKAKATFHDVFAITKDVDSISSEWSSGFAITFTDTFPRLHAIVSSGLTINDAVVQLFLETLAKHPDSLIRRKNGLDMAKSISDQAREIIELGGMNELAGRNAVNALDTKLASAGGRLNPGTTADLAAAALCLLVATGYKP